MAARVDAPRVLDMPPGHLELAWRPLHQWDADCLHTLLQAIETVDTSHERHSLADVEAMLSGSWKNMDCDSLGGFDDTGAMCAYAIVEIPPGDATVLRVVLRGGVHPLWRGRGIGRATLAWMEGRGRQMLAASGKDLPARLAVMVDETARDQRRLYAAAGFSPIRWYTSLRRDLRAPVPGGPVPLGVRVVPWDDALSDEVRRAHNEVARDRWDCVLYSAQSWQQQMAELVPEWSFVAIDEGSSQPHRVMGYLLSARHARGEEAVGCRCGYTRAVGVRRAARGRSLAGALVASALAAYQADGMECACLLVDTAGPAEAHGLCERFGYQAAHGWVMYSVEI